MASAEQYKLEQGRRPSFTNRDAIMAEPNGWYRNRGHRRRPGVVRGREPRTSDGRKHIVTSFIIGAAPIMRPFGELVEAYVKQLITEGELGEQADRYGALGYKARP